MMEITLSKLESLCLEGHMKARNEAVASLQKYHGEVMASFGTALLEILEPHGVTSLPPLEKIAFDPPQSNKVKVVKLETQEAPKPLT